MKWLIYLAPLFLFACSSLPKTIQSPPINDPQLEKVSADFVQYKDSSIRWGGKIITVNNDEQGSSLQVVQFPLNNMGRPVVNDKSQGRFLIKSVQFLDPEIYKIGRLATFSGAITEQQNRQVDKRQLLLPVIQMKEIHLWPEQIDLRADPFRDRFAYPYRMNGFYGWPYLGSGFRCF